jgi:hypothetical protein
MLSPQHEVGESILVAPTSVRISVRKTVGFKLLASGAFGRAPELSLLKAVGALPNSFSEVILC